MDKPAVRRQAEWVPLTKEQYRERFFARFYDPAFDEVKTELEKVFEKSWDGYARYRKSPRKRAAGPRFADPTMQLPVEWLEARARIEAAERRQKDSGSPTRILIVNGSTRSEHTCPGEISKTRRLAQCAQQAIGDLPHHEVDFLDVSALADEPWKVIHPCKACVSTSHIFAVRSALPVKSRPPLGKKATEWIWSVCPLRVASSRPVATSQSLAA